MTYSALPQELVDSDEMQQLLSDLGIAASYIDFGGHDVAIPSADRVKILQQMGECPSNREDINALRAHYHWLRPGHPLPQRTHVLTQGNSLPLYFLTGQLEQAIEWTLSSDQGEQLQGVFHGAALNQCGEEWLEGQHYAVRSFELPDLSEGYYQLSMVLAGTSVSVLVIKPPAHCFVPEWLQQEQKLAGLSIQLYGVRSQRNWGIGDFSDLRMLISELAQQGIDFLVLNPLHTLNALTPDQGSPYSPLDRRYLNPLYIDVAAVAEFQSHPNLVASLQESEPQAALEKLRATEHVDYPGVLALKMDTLIKAYEWLCSGEVIVADRIRDFHDWLHAKGSALREFTEFEAARQQHFDDARKQPEFHGYLQWLAESQLAACQHHALTSGMKIGLIRDLAVGSTRESAEVLLNPELFAMQASIGAPADVFAPQGQNWGLPPVNPKALEASNFRHFITLLRENMAQCGALRIDHVMALMRLWWCDSNSQTGEGGYVYYPTEALFAILCLESQRAQCVIIGEDLGVVPPEIRHLMYESAVLSNVLFYFEKVDPVHFKKPEHYPPRALSMVANHDVPTLRAWWNRSDLKLREEIGLLEPGEASAEVWRQRESDLIQVLHWLQECGQLPESWQDFNIHRPYDMALGLALLRANAQCASYLVSAQLADVCLQEPPVNIPGTSSEYTNWSLKLPVDIEDLFTQAEASKMLQSFAAARRS